MPTYSAHCARIWNMTSLHRSYSEKLWKTLVYRLKIDLDAVREKMKSGMVEDYTAKLNKSASLWWEMAQNWLETILG
ncbi:MAG: hypothetical protein ACOX1Q_00010 [Eubacteriales bacterium]